MAISSVPIRGVNVDSTTYYNNATGSTNSTEKLYIVGAPAQDNAEETFSNSNVYEQNGILTATGVSTTTINGVTVGNNPKFTDTLYTPSDATPNMDGMGAPGVSATYARGDHTHPSDTTKVPTTRTVNNKALSSDITLSASDVSAIPLSAKGTASGVAELDANGFVPAAQLPSYVDDIVEAATRSDFPTPGETGKIYVALDTNLTYRWSGSDYVEISPSLALGETSSTAYRGDRGKVAYDHATETKVSTASAQGAYKIAVTAEGHIGSVATLEKADIGLGNVDNTSDINKPISTAQQTALDLKAPLNSPAFTGTPTVPDLTSTSSTTQIANKQYVDDAIDASGFAILSYGHSTWQDFIDVYTTNRIVYCRASSQSNPATGSQTRLAFMAYVNNAENPTSVEFQYYRSVSSHTDAQQGDQVYVYKLDKTAGWTVAVREAYTKIVASTGMSSSYSNGTLTLTATGTEVPIDTEMSDSSTNPVQNKVIKGYVDNGLADKVDKETGKGLSTNDYTTEEKTKLTGIETGAEVNQNAFANIAVGSTTIAADAKQDTLTLTAGSNITLTPDAANDTVTIAATDTTYDVVSKTANGLAPQLPNETTTTKYLRQDGSWQVPPNNTYTAATSAPPNVSTSAAVGTSTNYARQDHTHAISLATGDNDGQVKIAGSNVSVKGLGSAAYTNSTAYLASGLKGAVNGLAELDANGLVPSTQLPSYVDDVLEYASKSNFPATGETGKIYIALDTNLTYRWSGSAYVEISPSLALGETSSTAYRGDRGKTAYTHATDASRLTTATASGLYKVASTAEGHIASLTAVQKSDITALGIPSSDTNTTYTFSGGTNKFTVTPSGGSAQDVAVTPSIADATTSASGLMSSSDKTKLNGIATGAEVNQNAFSNVVVGSTTIAADSKTDTITLVAGSNVTLTPDATNDKVTIAANDQNAFGVIAVGSTNIIADSRDDTFTLAQGDNITITPDSANSKATIALNQSIDVQAITAGDVNGTTIRGTDLTATDITTTYINGRTVGNSPKFTDTVTTVSTTGSGNAITALSADNGAITATKGSTFMTSHQTIKQDGVTGATVNRFGTCGTAAATAAKTVAITAGTFALEAGATVAVKFTNANTASTPTLNVASTGAKNIFVNGSQITTSAATYGLLKGTVIFIYDGTQYHLIGNYYDSNTTYSAGTGMSLSGTTFNHSNSVTAQTTQAIYPIKIDAQGHISAYGSAVTPITSISGTSPISVSGTAISHANSGATAGSYGDSAAQTPAYGATFKVPYVTVNATGHVTGISEHTVKIPASDNTDTKNTAGSTNSTSKLFLVGATSQAANPQTYSNSNVYAINGVMNATSYDVAATAHISYDSTENAILFTFS